MSQLTHSGLEEKLFFMDDGLLYGTPVAMKWTLELVQRLEQVSGLKLKFKKMSLYAPNAALARECRQLLSNNLEIHEDEDMNFVYLKSPIGSNDFVETYLEGKLTRLRGEIG